MNVSISTGSWGPGVTARGSILSSWNLSHSGRFKLKQINGQTSLNPSLCVWTPSNENWRAIARSLSLLPSKKRFIRSDRITSPFHISARQSSSFSWRHRSSARYIRSFLTVDLFMYISWIQCSSGIYRNWEHWLLESHRGDWHVGQLSELSYCLVYAIQPIIKAISLFLCIVYAVTLTFSAAINRFCL